MRCQDLPKLQQIFQPLLLSTFGQTFPGFFPFWTWQQQRKLATSTFYSKLFTSMLTTFLFTTLNSRATKISCLKFERHSIRIRNTFELKTITLFTFFTLSRLYLHEVFCKKNITFALTFIRLGSNLRLFDESYRQTKKRKFP